MIAQVMQFMVQSQQQQQQQMCEMMAQQLAFQQQLLSQQKKKGDPPTFKGNASEDLELCIFSTEQYYAQHREEMARNSSEFVDTIFANLGTVAQTWFRDFKFSLAPGQPATWKVLTKRHDLRWQSSQLEYTTKFLHLLSQLDEELLEPNVPGTLHDTIELAQRFEDSRPQQSARKLDVKRELKAQQSSGDKKAAPQKRGEDKNHCDYCDKLGHTIDVCRARKHDLDATVTGNVGSAKKRRGSVDRPPTEPESTARASSSRSAGHTSSTRHCFNYHSDDPVVRRDLNNVYCYLSHAGTISDAAVSAFVDSGASFNAVDARVVERLGLSVTDCSKPLELTLGMNNKVLIPRRVVSLEIKLTGFPVYRTEAFVMTIPEQKNALLGMPWLEEVNPEIDWKNRLIKFRGSEASTDFRQCVREGPATVVAGMRTRTPANYSCARVTRRALMYYTKHTLASSSGDTRVTTADRLEKLKLSDDEVCFFVNIASEKVTRQLATDWEALRGHPVEPIILKYKGKVFATELPSTPPPRSVDIEAEVKLSDTSPIVRKQFRLSEEQKEVVQKWMREMLDAKIIRPSKSPFSSPTFCVKKAVDWRVVHDFHVINARVKILATPIPTKEDIYDAVAKRKLFSALDLIWGFFQVRLRERDIPYTAFSTPDGLFEYLVTPMGLSCSPSAFNRFTQTVFEDQREFCRVYF
ncbi:hypothetical protein PHMEG_00028036 [Phytophthora megakarya]|uniref:Reverse transcriptase domain-containing protein n=1 Tax=Phytophthora megakarya TaxID=4795 RepID=A0A225V5U7_9STRA|nr:hypothetical protein PHMEG_00028036 [Phytophthora megakarya]